MSDEKALTIAEQREVMFYGDEITVVISEDRTVFVPVRPICDLMGVDAASQRRRIYQDPVLSEVSRPCDVIMTSQGQPTQRREMLCLPLDYLNGWLFGINADRVRPEIRDRLIRYQRDCYKVLAQAFQRQKVTAAPFEGIDVDELLRSGPDPEAQAYRMALAIANIARQQLVLRYQIQEQGERLDSHDHQLDFHAERLDQIEATLGDPSRHISAVQASRISQAVKAIALELGKRSGRNEFGGVYGEVYRRFEIAGYRELPAAKYDEAMRFLRDWYVSLTGKDMPF